MFCTNCGSQMPDGTTFCTNCGATLSPSAPVEPVAQPVPEMQPAPMVQPAPVAPVPMEQKKSSKAALWFILGVLLTVGVTVAILLLCTDVFKEEEKKNSSVSVVPYAGDESNPSGGETNQSGQTIPGLSDSNTTTQPTESGQEQMVGTQSDMTEVPTTTTSTTKKPTTTTINKPTQAAPVLSSDNPYADVYVAGRVYIFSDSASRKLTDADLVGLSLEELCVARNEIYARHGYVFSDKNLLEYFQQFSWYHPKGKAGDLSSITLSATEIANVETIRAYENALKNGEMDAEEDAGTITVSNDMIQMRVPEIWEDTAQIVVDSEHISFCETISSEEECGGYLFGISLYDSQDYLEMPSYTEVGELTDDEGNLWYVIATYPTDVQWSENGMVNYMAMQEEIDGILATVSACEGYTFEAY